MRPKERCFEHVFVSKEKTCYLSRVPIIDAKKRESIGEVLRLLGIGGNA